MDSTRAHQHSSETRATGVEAVAYCTRSTGHLLLYLVETYKKVYPIGIGRASVETTTHWMPVAIGRNAKRVTYCIKESPLDSTPD